jgi:DNA-directed RNA polymerase specialized sigma24 family protein
MSDAAPVPSDLLAHAALLRRLARTLLGDAHGAEDVVQETWPSHVRRPT